MSKATMELGPKITSLAQLEEEAKAGSYFYMGINPIRPKHWAFIQSMPLRVVINFINAGRLWASRLKGPFLKQGE